MNRYSKETTFVSGHSKGGIPSLNREILEDSGMKFFDCKNVYFKKHLIFQFVPISVLCKPVKNVILLGEVQVLSTWILLLYYKLRGVRCLVWTHGIYGNESKILNYLRVLFYNSFDQILVYNRRSNLLLSKNGLSERKIHTIYNSFNYNLLKRINDRLLLDKYEEFSLVFVGRLTRVKRLDILIEAVKNLKDKRKKLYLHIIGDGIERSSLEGMVNSKGLSSQVIFHGEMLDLSASSEIIKRCHVGVSPGNIGLTVVHLMSLGIPCITHGSLEHQMPESELILDGVNGSFFQRGDVVSLEEKIVLWREKFLKDEIPSSGVIRAEIDGNYNPDKQVEILLSVLQYD